MAGKRVTEYMQALFGAVGRGRGAPRPREFSENGGVT